VGKFNKSEPQQKPSSVKPFKLCWEKTTHGHRSKCWKIEIRQHMQVTLEPLPYLFVRLDETYTHTGYVFQFLLIISYVKALFTL